MRIEVDETFKNTGARWKRRRRRRLAIRLGLVGASLLSIGVVAVSVLLPWGERQGAVDTAQSDAQIEEGSAFSEDEDAVFIQSEATAEAAIVLAAVASEAFLDIRGEPMILSLPDDEAAQDRRFIADRAIDPFRAPRGSRLALLDDLLIEPGARVQVTLPSSSSDLAAFQNRQLTGLQTRTAPFGTAQSPGMDESVDAGNQVSFEDGEGSWGTLVGADAGAEQTVGYVETVIENTTTQRPALSASSRVDLFKDTTVRLDAEGALKAILIEKSVSEGEADRVVSRFQNLLADLETPAPDLEKLPSGSLIALRRAPARRDATVLQLSLYSADRYLATLVQSGPGRFELGADPWYNDNLLAQATIVARATAGRKDVRLKDAIYATSLRHGLPSDVVGELLVMLARVADLDKVADQKDRFKLLYSADETLRPAARLLYARLTVSEETYKCYVVRQDDESGHFECFDPDRRRAQTGGATSAFANGFVVPVNGTKTSSFGPRMHPILKRHVNHNGVDWAAPTGTPVVATAAGRISRADVSPSYGNIIYINHKDGYQSRYAHLNAFADGIRNGVQVEAGQLIGYVGTTGRSTGPHLHFELRISGNPIDPLAMGGAPVGGGGPSVAASGAVEALVNRIIQVESAGNARAKNPLSTATGLGQFIESTWLRMMRTYRPDLANTLGRRELLDLRFDPAMSRQMVTNLARENEAFLRNRGHAITPGRLYLAHFLGPAGAHTALSANPQASVLSVMGAGVVNANPFLRGKDVAWMTNWSDRKMRSASGKSVATAPPPQVLKPVSEEVKRYRAAVDEVLAAL